MDIKQLKYFAAIVEEGNITSAAKKLHMAQPPLSFQLKLLEEELGVRLIERGARKIRLTDAGQTLYKRAVSIISFMNSAELEIGNISKGTGGTLHIGTISSSGAALVKRRITEFNRMYPLVNFEIHEGNTFELLELLDAGKIEIGVVRTPFYAPKTKCIYLNPEPMVAVIPPKFAEKIFSQNDECQSSSITMDMLKDVPLIIYRRFEELILSRCAKYGFDPHFFCKNDDARTTILWADASLGVAIIPRSALGLCKNSARIFAEIDDSELYTRLAAIWRSDRYLSQTASNFLDVFASGDREAVSDLSDLI